jgi:hypothetical protein
MVDNYHEQIARYRQERAQREYVEKINALIESYPEFVRERDNAAQIGDQDGFDYYDDRCQELEREYQSLQPQQASPEKQAWLARHRDFLARHGARAYDALWKAHLYAVAPRNPNNSGDMSAGMGLAENSPAYFQAIEILLEMYGKDVAGVSFNSADTLTPDEVAEMCELSPRAYNREVVKMHEAGHDSASLLANQFKRTVG